MATYSSILAQRIPWTERLSLTHLYLIVPQLHVSEIIQNVCFASGLFHSE